MPTTTPAPSLNTSDERETIARVTAKLVGEFYIGQLVRVKNTGSHFDGYIGEIKRMRTPSVMWLGVDFGEHSDSEIVWLAPSEVEPAP